MLHSVQETTSQRADQVVVHDAGPESRVMSMAEGSQGTGHVVRQRWGSGEPNDVFDESRGSESEYSTAPPPYSEIGY